MKSRLIPHFYLILFIIPLSLCANLQSFKYTITNAELRHISLNRLADILFLVDEWHKITLDGFTIQTGTGDNQNYQNQNWLLLIDNQVIRNQIFEQANLNLLGLGTDQIDSIEVYPYAIHLNSSFSEQGAIHIHTKKKQGLVPAVQFISGNQTGDPGPYRYTKYETDNVDRIAADKSYHISFGDTTGYLKTGYQSQVFYPTHFRIRKRIDKIFNGSFNRIKNQSFFFQGKTDLLPGSPQLSLYNTSMDNFFHFKPSGQEIPTHNKFLFAGLNGNFTKSFSFPLYYQVSFTKNAMQKRQNSFNYDFDWNIEYTNINVHYNFNIYSNIFMLGTHILHQKYKSKYFNNNKEFLDYTLYGNLGINPFPNHSMKISGIIRNNLMNKEFGFHLLHHLLISQSQSLLLDFYYSKTSPASENSLWYWINNGYDLIPSFNINYDSDEKLSNTHKISSGISWSKKQDVFPSIYSGLRYRYTQGFNREIQTVQFDPVWESFPSHISLKTNQTLEELSFHIKSQYRFNKTLKGELYLEQNKFLGNKNKYQKQIPQHRGNVKFTYIPVETFSIWAKLTYQSAVYWYDYRNIYEESDGKFDAQLPEILRLDLAFNKWLWKKQIKASVHFNNLLNRTEIYHPAGASLDLRLFALLEINLNIL